MVEWKLTKENIHRAREWSGGHVIEEYDALDHVIVESLRLPSIHGSYIRAYEGQTIIKHDNGLFSIEPPDSQPEQFALF